MNEIKSLSIDLETYSDVDLSKCGVYKYTESDNFEILLFAYSINHGEVEVVDLAQGEKLPIEIIKALVDDGITKWAYNASFERVCLSRYISRYYPEYFISYSINEDTVNEFLNPNSWRCSMIWSAYLGLPLSLAGVGSVLGLEEQKLKEGKDLIKYFCVPCNPTKTNGGRTRNLPEHDIAKWELFKSYNKRDVEVEVSIQERLQSYPVPEFLWDEYHLDQEINDRGIALDMELVENAIKFDEIAKQKASEKLQSLTNIDNPNSVIIFDEVQLYPRARAAIKYLIADGRYDYIETGSLVSIKANVADIVIPSEERHIKMYPLDQVTESLITSNFEEGTPGYNLAYTQFFTTLEQTVEELTKCFLFEFGENKELSYGRCRKEKSFNELYEGLNNIE